MIEAIVDQFYFVQRGWLNANHFVFNGDRKILIDTGYKSSLQRTLGLIETVGVRPGQVDLIISTHSHCDHVGANRVIQEQSGCQVAMHTLDKHYIETQNTWFTWWHYYDQEADFFHVDLELQDGQVLNLGDLELQVLHVPGHASGQVALYSPRYRFLLSADAIWDGDFGALTPRIEGNISPFLQQKTLERLASLEISVIYPGHGSPVLDPRKAIARGLERVEAFLESPERMGRDQAKKLFIYVLLMKSGLPEEDFFDYLMGTCWFPETVDLFFQGCYREFYDDVLAELLRKDLVERRNGCLFPGVQD